MFHGTGWAVAALSRGWVAVAYARGHHCHRVAQHSSAARAAEEQRWCRTSADCCDRVSCLQSRSRVCTAGDAGHARDQRFWILRSLDRYSQSNAKARDCYAMLSAQLEAYQPLYHTFAAPVSAARKPLLLRQVSPVVARQPVAQRKDGKLVRQVSPVVALPDPAHGMPREPSLLSWRLQRTIGLARSASRRAKRCRD